MKSEITEEKVVLKEKFKKVETEISEERAKEYEQR